MKYKVYLFTIVYFLVICLLPLQVFASNSSTVSGGTNCTITFYYADSNGAYIGNSATLKPKTDYQMKATWKPGTCATVGSIRIGNITTQNSKSMAHYISCFDAKDFQTASTYKYVYQNMLGAGQAEGSKINNFLYVGDSNSNCSAVLKDREYIRTTAFAEISATFKEKTSTNKPAADTKTDIQTDTKTGNEKDVEKVAGPNTDIAITTDQSFDTVLGTFYNPLEFDRPEELVVRLINAMLLLVGIISVIMIILGGLRMVASGGSESQIKKGRETVTWAIGGLLVSLMAFSIVAIIQSIIS